MVWLWFETVAVSASNPRGVRLKEDFTPGAERQTRELQTHEGFG